MTNLNAILDVACSVARCSHRQVLSRNRRQKYVFARFIFFALATENDTRDYVAMWHIARHRSLAYHYKQQVAALSTTCPEFKNLLTKAKQRYDTLKQSV